MRRYAGVSSPTGLGAATYTGQAPAGLRDTWNEGVIMVKDVDPRVIAHLNAGVCWNDYLLSVTASGIPRRLGRNATGSELSQDKHFWRRAAHLYSGLTTEWEELSEIGVNRNAGDALQLLKRAKILVAKDFVEARAAVVQKDLTTAQQNTDKFSRQMAHLYQRELDGLERISRRAAPHS